MDTIPFSRPFIAGTELDLVTEVIRKARLSGDGEFTKACHAWLQERFKVPSALLTHSCTAALEMCALLLDLKPGDEVILPSYTFSSTANAICLRGATPVFVDIRPDTLNLDENLLEQAITPKTKAICPVHYAGVSCAMDKISEVAKAHQLHIFEDAAQALGSLYKNEPVGRWSDMSCLSFHATKNITSGEGGALLLNSQKFQARAEILWEKGTNRKQFLLGQVDKYSWVDIGSSFLPSELEAAFLMAQLHVEQTVRERRIAIWQTYHEGFADLEQREIVRRPSTPADCQHPAHMYYILLSSERARNQVLKDLHSERIQCATHYVPLHSAPAGLRFGRTGSSMHVTDDSSSRLLRLPLWVGLEEHQNMVLDKIIEAVRRAAS